MSSVINTNIFSLIAQNNLNNSQSSLQTSITRLSSGLRINSAADDPAGLAIADRMTAQINGTTQAQSNASDAISLVQTAGGALQQITNNLQNIRTLAVEATNATNSSSDRAALNQQVQQDIAEVNRLATQTTFNGLHVLDGSLGVTSFQVGANAGQSISVDLSAGVQSSQIGGIAQSGPVNLSAYIKPAGLTLSSGQLTIGGKSITGTFADANGLAAAINTAGITGLTATVNGSGQIALANSSASAIAVTGTQAGTLIGASSIAAGTSGVGTGSVALTSGSTSAAITINGTTVLAAGTPYTSAADLATKIQTGLNAALGASTGLTVTANGTNNIVFTNSSSTAYSVVGSDINAGTLSVAAATPTTVTSTGVAAAMAAKSLTLAAGDLSIQVGSNSPLSITGTFSSVQSLADAINSASVDGLNATVSTDGNSLSMTAQGTLTVSGAQATTLGLAGTSAVSGSLVSADVLTTSSAQTTIARIDAAISSVDALQSTMGAMQNRFQSAISSLSTSAQNLTSARSGVEDTNYAAETANLTRSNILQQAGISMLAQANAMPQQVLKLLQ
ncbi:MAG: flagellin [Burkholderiales bacterium]|nr:flagellin [Burkholderiales bacterium]